MKVLVLGGAGRTGTLVTRAAVTAGHEVTTLVRNTSSLDTGHGLRVLTGDATVDGDVRRAVAGQDAVISTLGSKSVWRSNIAAPAAAILVPIAEAEHVGRVVVMSAFGVGQTSSQSSFLVRAAFASVLRSLYKDKSAGDAIIRASSLDWTLVHPVTLTDGSVSGRVTASQRLAAKSGEISRADVADFLVGCLASSEWSRKTVIITSEPPVR